MNQQEQLESLRRARSSPGGVRTRKWGSLILLLAFVIGIALVFVLVFGPRLQPRVPVSVVPALLLESDGPAPAVTGPRLETMLAQASGWVEPDPFPIRVPVKVDGFVESVFVNGGDAVKQGQLLAILDDTDLALRVEKLSASLDEAMALQQVREHEVEQARHDRAVAEAENASAEARFGEAEDRLRRVHSLDSGDISEVDRIAVERAETEARLELEQAGSRLARADSVVEMRRVQLAQQASRLATIQVESTQARVDLERTQIRSPMDGRVLRRFAAPGMKRMAGMDDLDSATIVSLYDPDRLQVRVDVPLSDAGRMVTGMPAKVVTAALAGQVFTGTITRVTGEADIARNTLQVKVALAAPDPALRPEMLCRVEFFDSPGSGPRPGARTHQIWIPEKALEMGGEGSTSVWVVDPVSETVALREVDPGDETRDGLQIIHDGLRPGELVVVEHRGRLEPGTRVAVERE